MQQVHPDTKIDDDALELVHSLLDALLHQMLQSQPTTLGDVQAAV